MGKGKENGDVGCGCKILDAGYLILDAGKAKGPVTLRAPF